MSKHKLKAFRQILIDKKAEIENRLRHLEAIASQTSADELDRMQYSAEQAVAVHHLNFESDTLVEVMEALQRVDEGDFGKCVRCMEQISRKRLMAVPWTRFCIQCRTLGTLENLGRRRSRKGPLRH